MARKIEFDREKVLRDAMLLFWKQGYDNTSMSDLVQHLGINRFSIYNSFGDKKALYCQVLNRYTDTVVRYLHEPLMLDLPGKKRLDAYLSRLDERLAMHSGDMGCLIQATRLLPIARDSEIRERLSTYARLNVGLIAKALSDAQREGQCSPDLDTRKAAKHIACTVQGLILARTDSQSVKGVSEQIDFLKEVIESW